MCVMVPDFRRLCLKCLTEAVEGGRCRRCGAPVGFAWGPSFALAPGTVLDGRYLIGSVLGFGGFGITYLGLDLNSGFKIAVKEFMPSGTAGRIPGHKDISAKNEEDFQYGLSRFYDEARTVYQYRNHSNIIHVYKFFKENGTAYYVMEYLQGCDLKSYLKKMRRPLSFTELMPLMLPIMDALECIHRDHVIHRDISPDNIFLGNTVKLIDFGAARTAFAGQSKSLSIILKRGFAPEEQYRSRGRQGPWTDIYALAGTMYVSLTNKMVPEAPERLVADKIEDICTLAPTLAPFAGNAIMKALSVRAEDRYQNVSDFRRALTGAAFHTEQTRMVPDAFRIYGISGRYAGASLIVEGSLCIGRDPLQCQLVYPGEARGISRRQVCLTIDESRGAVILEDMYSSFGTWVNGIRLPGGVRAALNSGDRFSFGEKEVFEVEYLAW